MMIGLVGLRQHSGLAKKIGFLDGSIKQPEEGSSDLEDWWTIQPLLMSWIKMMTEITMRSNISHKDVPHKITSTFLLLLFFIMSWSPRPQFTKTKICHKILSLCACFVVLIEGICNIIHFLAISLISCGHHNDVADNIVNFMCMSRESTCPF